MIPRFDPTRSLVVDLGAGQIRDNEGTPRLNVPADALIRLCAGAGDEAVRDFGRTIGADMGRRCRSRLGSAVESAGLEAWVEHLGGEIGIAGFGNLMLERWGQALVFTITGAPRGDRMESLVAGVIEGALQRALSREAHAAPLGWDDDTARFVIVSDAAAGKVTAWLGEGADWRAIVQRLHGGQA